MPEFLFLLPPADALTRLIQHLTSIYRHEVIPTETSLGRVTAAPVKATGALPAFPRSTVDGFAVLASDTHGASESLPAYLQVAGETPMGSAPSFSLRKGQCALIHTGGMLPDGADAVVMVEHTQSVQAGEIEVMRAVASGENVLKTGEEVAPGEEVIPAGTRLRPAEIGGLMALGITRVEVMARPRVGLISTGDEIIPPAGSPGPGQVRDVNAFTLSALVEQAGAEPVRYGIIADNEEALSLAAQRAMEECDMVVITAGSSASSRDLTAQVINSLGAPGVLVHGVNVRPGKPTILAVCKGKPVIGLPGNPVSALVIASLFITPVIAALLGVRRTQPKPSVRARLSLNLPSQAGREDWIAVQLFPEKDGYRAEPVFGKSNFIFNLAHADGLVRIPPDATGLGRGEMVDVYFF